MDSSDPVFRLARGLYVRHYRNLQTRYKGRADPETQARDVAQQLVKQKHGDDLAAAVRKDYHGE